MIIEKNIVRFFVPTDNKNEYLIFEAGNKLQNFFIFAFIRQEPLPQKLKIKAVQDGKEKFIDLVYMPKHFYRAEVGDIGIFYFRVDNPRDLIMMDEDKAVKLSTLTPINEDLFESACKEHKFFFVG